MTLRPQTLFIIAFILIVIPVTLYFKSSDTDFESAKELIVMRTIGHEVLLSSGDSTSRVLPVNKTGNNHYRIRFEGSFQFTPDSIVRIVQQAIEANNLPFDYIVNVVELGNNQVVYGFATIKTENTNLVPCKSRVQPRAHYVINITFHRSNLSTVSKNYYAGAGSGLTALLMLFLGIRISYRDKRSIGNRVPPPSITSEVISIGTYEFYRNKQYLEHDKEQIELSDKESKLLNILAGKQNELVERAELQKVWEDEGVIVGRSLDMFISKLRKKLEKDPKVRLVNIHGKGYKLEAS